MLRLIRSTRGRYMDSMRAVPTYKSGGTGLQEVNTAPQPEGIYFKYIYSFDNTPEQFGGFKDVFYNAYLDKPLFDSDNFEFE